MEIRFQPEAEAELAEVVCGIHFNLKGLSYRRDRCFSVYHSKRDPERLLSGF
jgi:hypothetical protein